MVVFDTTFLLFVFSDRPGAPLDPKTNLPVTRPLDRIDLLLKTLDKKKVKVIIPTPALAEILVRAGKSMADRVSRINGHSAFKIVHFDERAAIQVAMLCQDPGDRPRNQTETLAKIKYDRQIAAIAKVENAEAIYTDDGNIKTYAERLGITAFGIGDLPLPPDPKPTTPDLFAELPDVKELAKPEGATDAQSERPGGEPTGAVPADGEGSGLQPEPGGVRAEAGEDRPGEASPEAEEDELTPAISAAPPTPSFPPEAPPPPSSPEKA